MAVQRYARTKNLPFVITETSTKPDVNALPEGGLWIQSSSDGTIYVRQRGKDGVSYIDVFTNNGFGRQANSNVGKNSFTAGNGLYAEYDNQIAFGQYNEGINKDNILELGNGTGHSSRKTIVSVKKNGDIDTKGNFSTLGDVSARGNGSFGGSVSCENLICDGGTVTCKKVAIDDFSFKIPTDNLISNLIQTSKGSMGKLFSGNERYDNGTEEGDDLFKFEFIHCFCFGNITVLSGRVTIQTSTNGQDKYLFKIRNQISPSTFENLYPCPVTDVPIIMSGISSKDGNGTNIDCEAILQEDGTAKIKATSPGIYNFFCMYTSSYSS